VNTAFVPISGRSETIGDSNKNNGVEKYLMSRLIWPYLEIVVDVK
jgi:hypothetical protein